MNILKSALGRYECSGDPAHADVIVGASFGTSTHRKSPNGALAEFILEIEDGQPIVVDRTLAESFPNPRLPDIVVDDAVSNAMGSVGGSWDILSRAKEYMDEEKFNRPLLVAQAFHIGRVAMQAEKIGMHNRIIPSGLPTIFDRESDQLWTRSVGLWVPREVIGSFALRYQDKL